MTTMVIFAISSSLWRRDERCLLKLNSLEYVCSHDVHLYFLTCSSCSAICLFRLLSLFDLKTKLHIGHESWGLGFSFEHNNSGSCTHIFGFFILTTLHRSRRPGLANKQALLSGCRSTFVFDLEILFFRIFGKRRPYHEQNTKNFYKILYDWIVLNNIPKLFHPFCSIFFVCLEKYRAKQYWRQDDHNKKNHSTKELSLAQRHLVDQIEWMSK